MCVGMIVEFMFLKEANSFRYGLSQALARLLTEAIIYVAVDHSCKLGAIQ